MQLDDVKSRLEGLGTLPAGSTPEDAAGGTPDDAAGHPSTDASESPKAP